MQPNGSPLPLFPMKPSPFLLALAIAVAAVALAPSSQAAEIPPIIVCVTEPCCGPCLPPAPDACDLEAATPDQVPFFLIPANPRQTVWGSDEGCDVDVETTWYCLFGGIPVDRTVGPVHVATIVCTPDLPPIDLVEMQ